MSTAEAESVDRAAWPYRMKDLCDKTGLERQAIHFYIHEGLLPEGHKTGKNMAYYGEEHLERLRLIKKLQDEQFLPLKAIRAVLGEKDEPTFSDAQKRLLEDVKQRLSGSLARRAGKRATVDARSLMLRAGIDRKDLDDMVEIGLLAVSHGPRGKLLVAEDDAWMIELWGQVRAAGFTKKLGFDAKILAVFERAIAEMFDKETAILTEKLADLPADEVARMVERALPLVHSFMIRYHQAKVEQFFAAM